MTRRFRVSYCRTAICSPAFVDEHCYEFYERRLLNRLAAFRIALSAYSLLPDAVYLLAASDSPFAVRRLLRELNRDYALYFSNRFGRVGSVWRSDCHHLAVPCGQTLLDLHKFIERRALANPGCETPGQHAWSSYHLNAFGRDDRLSSFPALDRLRGGLRGSFARYRSFIARDFAEGYESWLQRQVDRGGELRAAATPPAEEEPNQVPEASPGSQKSDRDLLGSNSGPRFLRGSSRTGRLVDTYNRPA